MIKRLIMEIILFFGLFSFGMIPIGILGIATNDYMSKNVQESNIIHTSMQELKQNNLKLTLGKVVESNTPPPIPELPKIAVILARFSDRGINSDSKDRIADFLIDLDLYWQHASYSKVDVIFELLEGSNQGWYDLPRPENPGSPDNPYDLQKDSDVTALFNDAVAAADQDYDFKTTEGQKYDYILIWVNSEFPSIFYTEGPYNFYTITTQDDPDGTGPETGDITVGVVVVGEDYDNEELQVVWGKAAHGMAHIFGFKHTHTSEEVTPDPPNTSGSKYALMGRFPPIGSSDYPSDLTGYTRTRTLVTGNDGWISSSNLRIIKPGEEEENIDVKPRNRNLPGLIQLLRVDLDEQGTSYYMVEVIERNQNDVNLPEVPGDGVLIYKVDASGILTDIDSNTDLPVDMGSVNLDDILYSEVPDRNKYENIDEDIIIEIKEKLVPGPGYKISVSNNYSPPPNLMITPWKWESGSPHAIAGWDTEDIWVDSYVNTWGECRRNPPTYPTVCAGNGDDPWAGHENRLYARIHNIGGQPVENIKVHFYDTDLTAGVWDFQPVGTNDSITFLAPGDSAEVFVMWTPRYTIPPDQPDDIVEVLGCVRVKIDTVEGETQLSDNEAQENIHTVEILTDAAPPYPGMISNKKILTDEGSITIPFLIGNPFFVERTIYLNVFQISKDWDILDVDMNNRSIAQFHTLGPRSTKSVGIRIFPNHDLEVGTILNAEFLVAYILSAKSQVYTNEMAILPFGGISIPGTVVYRTQLCINAEPVGLNEIQIAGLLSSPHGSLSSIISESAGGARKILLEIINTDNPNEVEYLHDEMDDNGRFILTFKPANNSKYTVIAHYAGSDKLARSKSLPMYIIAADSSIQIKSECPLPSLTIESTEFTEDTEDMEVSFVGIIIVVNVLIVLRCKSKKS